MNENGIASTLSPALEWVPVDEAVLVDDGWKALSMLVRIPPTPPPLLELDTEVGVELMAVVVVSTPEVTVAEVVATWDEVVARPIAPLPVPAAI